MFVSTHNWLIGIGFYRGVNKPNNLYKISNIQ